MKVHELIEHLKALPQDKEILCQVVAKDGSCWYVHFEFIDTQWRVVALHISHPDLTTLR